ncbi:ABC transporter permease [Kitasatospora azatica]|uniref:ABC transporter permease n=1 Tax=Kitasatospora azatica TaxID=58347 RepID=UPI00056761F7|nr:ABC transporter permease subunit [Kitasatospora azatica]
MIWLTWRQHRKQALFTAIALLLISAALVPTGLQMHNFFDSSGLAACRSALGSADLIPATTHQCGSVQQQFTNRFGTLPVVAVLLLLLPLLVGLFFGAPLVSREVEQGTHRLVWTQGVSRSHWALVKFGLIGAVGLVVATGYALLVSWWIEPLAITGPGRFAYGYFDVQGIAPIGYTLFALALGIFAGSVWHKVLPAMAATLGGYALVRVLIEVVLRPHYATAKVLTYAVDSPVLVNRLSGSWVYSEGVRTAADKLILRDGQIGCQATPAPGAGPDDLCVTAGRGAYNFLTYQPASRFWEFQSIETGIFLALTAALLYFTIRRLRRVA